MGGAQGGEELERTVAGVDALRDTPARNGRGCCAISETCRGLMDNERILELVVDACETELHGPFLVHLLDRHRSGAPSAFSSTFSSTRCAPVTFSTTHPRESDHAVAWGQAVGTSR